MVAFYEGASIPWGRSVSEPQYPTLNPNVLGNALSNLIGNFQQAQQGQQRTQANDLGLQEGRMRLNQAKAFAGGVPMNPDGTPNYSAIMTTLAQKGDIGAIGSLAPIIQQERNIEGADAPDQFFGGGYSNGTGGGAGNTAAAGGLTQSLIARGYSPAAAAGIVGNLGQESGFNAGSVGDQGTSGGLAQWHGDRLAKLENYAVSVGRDWRDPQVQIDFLDKEVRSNPQLYASLNAAKSPAEAADIFMNGFERPAAATANAGRREAIASSAFGGAGGAGGSAASAYANPDQPSVPPVSAAAGSTIPRGNAPTAAQAVGGGAPPQPDRLAANNPAWTGINAALPVGPSGIPAQPARASTPQAAANPQGSVASIASSAGIPPQVSANIAKAIGVAPNAPLTPQQELRAKAIIQSYVARRGQAPQTASIAQGQPSTGGPIVPQFPLPRGFTDPQQAILAIDQDIARLSRFGPAAVGRIRVLEDMRNRIAASSAPMDVRPGQTIIDPRTGKTLFQSPVMPGRGGITQDRADDIAQAIQSGDQPPVLTGLYGASSLVRSSLARNGFDLSKAQLQWDAAKKQIASLNGPQQVRFVGLANSVVNAIDEVKERAEQMQLSGVPLLNKAKLLAYIQTAGNSEGGQLATRYINAVNTAKEEFANLANGGYAPTDAAWKLANDQINGNYGVKQLDAALSESQRLIKYRLAAMPGMSTAGPGAANRYFPGNEQAPPPPAAAPSAGGLPPGWSVEVH